MVYADASLSEFVIPRTFLAIAVVIVVARLVGMLAKMVRQPPVVGEIIGGILMGPTLLGAFPGDLDGHLFPTEIRPFLTVIANLGLIIFMFIVGLELDTTLIRGKERIAGVISLSSIMLPMTLGILLAVYLHDSHGVVAGEEIKFTPFALFIGASMSITAFPVLARIMIDRGMYRTQIGAITLASAAVDDILAWSLLAIVLAVIETGTFFTWEFPRILGLSIGFGVVMFGVIKPLLARLVPAHAKAGRLTPNLAASVLVGVLVSAFVTSKIGVHHILGAFTFGAVMPKKQAHALTHEIMERLEQVTLVLLLPVFFVTTGLGVDVRSLRAGDLGTLALILLTACAGKFIGATVAANLQGIRPLRKAGAIGVLMNTRGLTELIILSVGREAGVLDEKLFTMLVLMAIITTVITEPGLRLFYPDRMLARDVAEAERLALGLEDAYRVLVAVDDPAAAERAVDLAADIIGTEKPSEVVLSRLVATHNVPELGAGFAARLVEMTESIEAMAGLEQRVRSRGTDSRVLTRYSDELGNDLAGHARTTETDVVMLVADTVHGDSDPKVLANELDHVVVRFRPSARPASSADVAVIVDDGDDAVAAFELAARIARTRGGTLLLVSPNAKARRWADVPARLAGVTTDARFAETPDGAGLVVSGGGTGARADDATRRDWDQLVVWAPPDVGRTPMDVIDGLRALTAGGT